MNELGGHSLAMGHICCHDHRKVLRVIQRGRVGILTGYISESNRDPTHTPLLVRSYVVYINLHALLLKLNPSVISGIIDTDIGIQRGIRQSISCDENMSNKIY